MDKLNSLLPSSLHIVMFAAYLAIALAPLRQLNLVYRLSLLLWKL
ncbi:MAG: hypothetical protein RMX96_30110 [Nostoc sp. ChiSLP02]|nr:hypothetical protein [Nostoc sp. DedSLP05]MDZ8100490.1 hypothetical protein [Nostoc sp. DedSLP01]MDZ8189086.1 hypothetical protein [Nostoc sp. ChiSLP02]